MIDMTDNYIYVTFKVNVGHKIQLLYYMKTLLLLTRTRVHMSRFRLLNNVRQSAPGVTLH